MAGREASPMTRASGLVLRARQILDDQTLPNSQRIANSASLLAQLRQAVEQDAAYLLVILNDIDDPTVKESMRQALTA